MRLLLLDVFEQRAVMPWEVEKRLEEVAIPVSIWEPEEEGDVEVEDIIVDAPFPSSTLVVPKPEKGEMSLPWATDTCGSADEIGDDDESGEGGKKGGKHQIR